MKHASGSVVGIAMLVGAVIGASGCTAPAPAPSDEVATTPSGSTAEPGATPTDREPEPEPVERTPSASEELQILEATAWPDGMGEWRYLVIVQNPSDELAYFSDRFDVEALSADGTVVQSSSTYTTVLPEAQTVVTGALDLDESGAETLSVQTPQTATVVEPGSVGSFEISDVELTTADGNDALVGTVTSHFAETQKDPALVAVFRDPSGTAVHVEGGNLWDEAAQGDDIDFSILMTGVPDGAVPEVYGVPTGVQQDPTSLRSADRT